MFTGNNNSLLALGANPDVVVAIVSRPRTDAIIMPNGRLPDIPRPHSQASGLAQPSRALPRQYGNPRAVYIKYIKIVL